MADRLFDLSEIIALVIGGTGVLGGALAEALATAGAAVAIAGRNEERGNARCVRIRSSGATAEFFHADASSRESLRALRKKVTSKLGTATVLVNAAGGNDPRATVTPENPFEKISSESWSSCFELNVTGSILLPCQEFGPAMCAAGKGSIINIASVAGHLPLSRVVAYSAAKAAALSLTSLSRARMGTLRRACEFHNAWIFSSRSKPPPAFPRRRLSNPASGLHSRPHADRAVWRSARTGGRGCFSCKRRSEQLRDGGGYPRRRRIPCSDDL